MLPRGVPTMPCYTRGTAEVPKEHSQQAPMYESQLTVTFHIRSLAGSEGGACAKHTQLQPRCTERDGADRATVFRHLYLQ
jgi:hypothetical protein